MGRRANGEGSFSIKSNGLYSLRKQVGILPNGRPKILTVSANSKSACISLMKIKEEKLNESVFETKVSKNISLSELCLLHLEEHIKQVDRLKPKSIDRREGTIKNQISKYKIGRLQISSISSLDIERHIETLLIENKLSVSSIKKAFDVINSAYNWAISQGMVVFNPCTSIKDKIKNRFVVVESKRNVDKHIVVLTDMEEKKLILLSELKNKDGSYKYPIGRFALFLLYSGIRSGELCALKWSDYDKELKTLSITKTRFVTKKRNIEKGYSAQEGIVKNAKMRVIELNQEAIDILDGIYNSTCRNREDDYILLNRNGRPTNPSNMGANVKSLFNAAGLVGISGLHTFRRTFATRMYNETKDLKAVAAYIGDLETTVSKHYIATTRRIVCGGKTINVVPLPQK